MTDWLSPECTSRVCSSRSKRLAHLMWLISKLKLSNSLTISKSKKKRYSQILIQRLTCSSRRSSQSSWKSQNSTMFCKRPRSELLIPASTRVSSWSTTEPSSPRWLSMTTPSRMRERTWNSTQASSFPDSSAPCLWLSSRSFQTTSSRHCSHSSRPMGIFHLTLCSRPCLSVTERTLCWKTTSTMHMQTTPDHSTSTLLFQLLLCMLQP